MPYDSTSCNQYRRTCASSYHCQAFQEPNFVVSRPIRRDDDDDDGRYRVMPPCPIDLRCGWSRSRMLFH